MDTVEFLRGRKLPSTYWENITEGFSELRERGAGPNGTKVYEVNLKDGDIAVKRHLEDLPGARTDKEYTDSVHSITGLKHENVVEWLAFCLETRANVKLKNPDNENVTKPVFVERIFCYEYFPKGSLHHNLFVQKVDIDWETRFKIIEGICKGLQFLHTRQPKKIIHLNLKPQNIMLDDEMKPKIGDFGYSRIIADPKKSQLRTQSSVGSVGYMAPEYLKEDLKEISSRFDIYSLGLIIIEIITRKNNCSGINQESARGFINEVQKYIDEDLMDLEYPGLEEDHLEHQIKCIKIGLECVNLNHKNRPKIVDVITKLYKTL